jgi:hypothetical protein
MVHVVFVFCMLTAPTQCQERGMPGGEALTLFECTMGAQRLAQDWLVDNPGWTLARWRCVAEGRPNQPA